MSQTSIAVAVLSNFLKNHHISNQMNSSMVLGLFVAVALGLLLLATTETAPGQCDPSVCGTDPLKK